MMQQSIRIRLKAFDHRTLDLSTQGDRVYRQAHWRRPWSARCRCRPALKSSPSTARPTSTRRRREQFEIRTHKRVLDIVDPTPQTVDALMKLDLSAGVDVADQVLG